MLARESKKKTMQRCMIFCAGNRGRTGTGITTHGILSPGRLPIPPCRQQATQTGLEPVTSAVTGRRSNQLSHWAMTLKTKY